MKLAFFDTKPYDRVSFEKWKKEYPAEIHYFEDRLTARNAVLARGCEGVCIFVNDEAGADCIELLAENGVRVLVLRCAGYNQVDLKAAAGKIRVLRVPEYSPYAVAEHAAALMLTLNRKTHKSYNRTREGNFALDGLLGFDMQGKTAGIIGTGRIALKLIRILKGFGMNVSAYDLYPNREAAAELDFRYTSLEELYGESDIISLHVPLTPETRYLIRKESIEKMKKSVMLVNTGRGELIKTKDLVDALKKGRIGSAALDVYEEEREYFFEDRSANILKDDVLARLLTFNNVLITSHQAFFTREALDNIARTTLSNLRDFSGQKPLLHEVRWDSEKETVREGI